jgi:hypothetical protein
MYKPSTYLVITYFPTYLPIYETYFLHNWLPRWNQMLTQLMFIHNLVIIGIQWMLHAGGCCWFTVAGTLENKSNFLYTFRWVPSTSAFFIFLYRIILPHLTKCSKIIRIYSRKKNCKKFPVSLVKNSEISSEKKTLPNTLVIKGVASLDWTIFFSKFEK